MVGALALGGCSTMDRMGSGQTWTMATSDQTQSAAGHVKVDKEKNGNTKVKVEVERLAQPSAAFEDSSTYVVWIQPAGGQPQNVGVLNVDKKLKGKLETTTPFKHFQVMVTAEARPNVTIPTGPEVMTTNITVPT
jgi:hypothetical protein